MTRDETIALFLECERLRAHARAEGKSEAEAHETAKAHWNVWARARLAEMQQIVAKGNWKAERRGHDYFAVEPANRETQEWAEQASCRLTNTLVEPKGWHRAKQMRLSTKTKLQIGEERINLSGFIFPWAFEADFSFFAPVVLFNHCIFYGPMAMYECEFYQRVYFLEAKFMNGTRFNGCTFHSRATFNDSHFHAVNRFDRALFKRSVRFEKTKFVGEVWFSQATFESKTNFQDAKFEDFCCFDACYALRNCNFDRTVFSAKVPSFHQAHFVEAPSLDLTYLPISCSLDHGSTDAVRSYRALKRLAIQGHDTDRELAFFSGEVRSARFASDWPSPWPIWKPSVWGGFFRFWFGILYEVFSDFGRSVFRPFAAWIVGILAFAAFYLSQTEVMQRDLLLKDSWAISATVRAGGYALLNTFPCYPPPTYGGNWRKNWRLWEKPKNDAASNSNETIVGGLSEKLRGQTNARAEALHLAFRNAFVVLDGGSDASHRMYGCLYGLEMYAGQNPVPIVPSAVSTASAIQKLISGVLIFLFGLALRNMLKVK